MLIQLKTYRAGPGGSFAPGDIIHVPDDEGRRYIAAKKAVAVTPDQAPRLLTLSDQARYCHAMADGKLDGAVAEDGGAGPKTYIVSVVAEMTRMSNTTLNKYAKTAGVPTPKKGQKNFRYPAADVRTILTHIIRETTSRETRETCRAALLTLPKIAE